MPNKVVNAIDESNSAVIKEDAPGKIRSGDLRIRSSYRGT